MTLFSLLLAQVDLYGTLRSWLASANTGGPEKDGEPPVEPEHDDTSGPYGVELFLITEDDPILLARSDGHPGDGEEALDRCAGELKAWVEDEAEIADCILRTAARGSVALASPLTFELREYGVEPPLPPLKLMFQCRMGWSGGKGP